MNTSGGDVITLDNCASEPIHIPGLVQSHGALLAFEASGCLQYLSSNARALLGPSGPSLGEQLTPALFDKNAAIHDALREALDASQTDEHGLASLVLLNERGFDLVTHRFAGMTIAEFEPRSDADNSSGAFDRKARRAIGSLKQQLTIDDLLKTAVRTVRELTGFDRVMAYRFRHDDSGEIVAESKIDSLDSFLGRRYPSGDIPAQARRLYLANTLRMIVDVNATPSALATSGSHRTPLDMSHCVLRCVSSIHLEYLRNIGVGASMSISIVVNGKLWGMIACHHGIARPVPFFVRMACDVLAQLLAASIQSLLARQQSKDTDRASMLRTQLIEVVLHEEDSGGALATLSPQLLAGFGANAVIVSEVDKLFVEGPLAPEKAREIVAWLTGRRMLLHEVLIAETASDMPPSLGVDNEWCGMLAMRYDELSVGWLVMLRREQVEIIHWGDEPRKVYPSGPLGVRLTPQGSAAVWLETVRGKIVPWTATERDLGRQLADELARASSIRMAELNRARSELLAMLGHDLRDPLQSITMASLRLEVDQQLHHNAPGRMRLTERIRSSTGRMSRLIGHILDASRLQTGIGLATNFSVVDLSRVIEDLLEEARTGYPGTVIIQELPPTLMVAIDADRIGQLVGNLVSNARQHGVAGEPISVHLSQQGREVFIEVSNMAASIDPEILPHLFSAFYRLPSSVARNKSGLGLGLHIAQAIARAHHGHIRYRYSEPYVVFTLRFPLTELA